MLAQPAGRKTAEARKRCEEFFPARLVYSMRIEIVKRRDGSGLLRCTRAGGSITWQKQTRHAAFFALHDLTHYAVESVLGVPDGFYGLIAQGWEIDDTTGKGSRGPLPEGGIRVEHIVGWLDRERASGTIWDASDLQAAVLTEEELAQIRARREELFEQFAETPPGEALVLNWDEGSAH